MLIKEYRIPLPLTVEEYRIAQLYMIAKKSRDESKGAGSGVEILVNEPYTNGPGGNGQYTHKIYHVGNHLPGWFKSLLPKSALSVEEEAWNAYPYTKTRYTCPFVEKFSIEIETVYHPDPGTQENVFALTGSDLRARTVDLIDVVTDLSDYSREEDLTLYRSEKFGRGPLNETWLTDISEAKGKPLPCGIKDIMCAYKLCKVEFRYWGMQSKLEKYIHDSALRRTMLNAHRQAWLWQDEWYGLTMDDIRKIERDTQEALRRRMAAVNSEEGTVVGDDSIMPKEAMGSIEKSDKDSILPIATRRPVEVTVETPSSSAASIQANPTVGLQRLRSSEFAHWKMDTILHDSDSSSDGEEYFDCQDAGNTGERGSLVKWSSLELLTEDEPDHHAHKTVTLGIEDAGILRASGAMSGTVTSSGLSRTASERYKRTRQMRPSPTHSTKQPFPCQTTSLILVFHASSVLDATFDLNSKKSDVTTFRCYFEQVMKQHYSSIAGRVAIRLIPCPNICSESLSILSSISPYSFDVSPSCVGTDQQSQPITHDSMPIAVVPVFSTINSTYKDALAKVISIANTTYRDFLASESGLGFDGSVHIIGDCIGSLLAYDALCCGNLPSCSSPASNPSVHTQSTHISNTLLPDDADPESRRGSSGSSICSHSDSSIGAKLEFEAAELYMFGSPLPLVLTYRQIHANADIMVRPAVQQVYNLFHPADPVASRLEPLLSARFSMLPPVNVPRYQKYPLGNGVPYHLLEVIQSNSHLFSENSWLSTTVTNSLQMRRMSDVSIFSDTSGFAPDPLPINLVNTLMQKWWGIKRLDYAVYCPDGLSNFPANALPHLIHASYWESTDVIAFILRQLGGFESCTAPVQTVETQDASGFVPTQPKEKWIRKRTSVKLSKLKNIGPNHRANDVIVKDGAPQTLIARFMYGSYDVITLTGEKVDIHAMSDTFSSGSEWCLLSTELTDKTGRVSYTIPQALAFSYGIHHIKMVVRGDHTTVDFKLAVVPPRTECIVFSIDGSFTASVSVTGRDPKVRAGAVDVVRQWQELGYVILYVSARPDMQQQLVISWLIQHNFPYGLVAFADRFSTDPLAFKTQYLKTLTQEHDVVIFAAYGSNKDVSVYKSIGLKANQIYIVGRLSKKHANDATLLADGYSSHLATLMPRPAFGNARMLLFPRGCLARNASLRRPRSAKRTTSYPVSPSQTTG